MSNTVTSKGQVTIPKKIRDFLGIKPGASVDFELREDRQVVLVKAARKGRRTSPFARARGRATASMSTDEIMALTRGEM
jgi:AbrB family looped-hinge helix DNA binding protein